MPGYGIVGPTQGSGLLPWSWAEQRLVASRNYRVASRWPDGRPHAMPVWGVWHDEAFWFFSSRRSRKARNLAADPRCVVTTENPVDPVVVEGTAEVGFHRFAAAVSAGRRFSAMEFVGQGSDAKLFGRSWS
jgi:hypothetical protein